MSHTSVKRELNQSAATRADKSWLVKKMARKVTGKAYTAALETGRPVMVVQDGWICNVFKDGHVEKIRAVEAVPDLRGRTFSL
jgi:hypothetical protein